MTSALFKVVLNINASEKNSILDFYKKGFEVDVNSQHLVRLYEIDFLYMTIHDDTKFLGKKLRNTP